MVFCTLAILSVNAASVPPGSYDEIDERLKPFGSVAIAVPAEDEVAQEPAQVAQQASFEKVGLSEGSEHIVEMLNSGPEGSMVFKPAVLKVSLGDTVHFRATDLAHNSAAIEGMIPDGAEKWAGLLSTDISVTLDQEGIYVYQCDPHLVMAMVGVIQVGDAVNREAVYASAEAMKENFAMNPDRLINYLSQL
jgi:pseudoazurin